MLIEYLAKLLPAIGHTFVTGLLDEEFNISVINRIEVLGHASVNQATEDFLSLATVHELTQQVAQQTIQLRKTHRIKLPDAIIAATALTHGFTIVTRNTSDFKTIAGLPTINPHEV